MSDNEKQFTPGSTPENPVPEKLFRVNIAEEHLNVKADAEDIQSYANNMPVPQTAENRPGARAVADERARRKEAREHRKRNRVKSRKNKRIFAFTWLAMIVLVSLMISSYLIGGSNDFLAVDRMESEVDVVIPEDVTQEQLTEILHSCHAIEKPEFFTLYCMLTTKIDYFPSGEYTIRTNMDYEALINELQAGPDLGEEITVMFPEGMTVVEFAEILAENGLSTKDEILEACNSTLFDQDYEDVAAIQNVDDRYYKLEGYLFPDTYNFFEKDSAEAILKRFLNNFEHRVDEEMRADIEKSGYSLDEIVVLASIIQAEAANNEDMYMISAVLHNGLRDGAAHNIFSLDCDSTLFYPYNGKSEAPEGYLSDYSTYSSLGGVSGLPAGAICNPGLEAIRAAIYPAEEGSTYYYFCHDSSRNAYYAATMDEHTANLRKAGLLD